MKEKEASMMISFLWLETNGIVAYGSYSSTEDDNNMHYMPLSIIKRKL